MQIATGVSEMTSYQYEGIVATVIKIRSTVIYFFNCLTYITEELYILIGTF